MNELLQYFNIFDNKDVCHFIQMKGMIVSTYVNRQGVHEKLFQESLRVSGDFDEGSISQVVRCFW